MLLSTDDRLSVWVRLFEDQKASGLTITDWCRQRGMAKNTFYDWRKRLAASDPVVASRKPSVGSEDSSKSTASSPLSSAVAPQWLSVPMTSKACSITGLTLRIGMVSIEVSAGFDPHLLTEVLGVLEARC